MENRLVRKALILMGFTGIFMMGLSNCTAQTRSKGQSKGKMGKKLASTRNAIKEAESAASEVTDPKIRAALEAHAKALHAINQKADLAHHKIDKATHKRHKKGGHPKKMNK